MTALDADVAIIVPAAGAGLRLGPGDPKALRRLAGQPLLAHTVKAAAAAAQVGIVVAVVPADRRTDALNIVTAAGLTTASGPEITVVAGGATRQESVAAGLAAVPARFPIVLVHDAARALTPPDLISEVAAAVRAGHEAVVPVLPVADTVVEVDASGEVSKQLDRGRLRAVQTPQGFRRAVLIRAHADAAAARVTATDDASLVARLGVSVHTVPGSEHALKITTGHDLAVAAMLLHQATQPA